MAKKTSSPTTAPTPPSASDDDPFGFNDIKPKEPEVRADNQDRPVLEPAPDAPVTEPGQEPAPSTALFTDVDPKANPVVLTDPTVAVHSDALTDSERVDLVLRSTEQPIAASIVKAARVGLEDLSVEHQLELAIRIYERIGKAAGHLPEFQSLTENMKGAYLGAVRDVWLDAQRKARSYNE